VITALELNDTIPAIVRVRYKNADVTLKALFDLVTATEFKPQHNEE